MKKRLFLLSFTLLVSISMAFADNASNDGVFIVTPDSTTMYKLCAVPRISYTENAGVQVAQILIGDSTEPVISVELKKGQTLSAFYCTYVPDGIEEVSNEKVTIYRKSGHKYISGGKLIIVGKDGKKYDSNGIEIQD